ncbi:hypothetical protein CFHF_11145 [Caulobacter flavus]|uniref:Uncharacterized protein n=1 Tax=Caulobacter flavus TaxID=1679497 RepID=A0A2N5CU54_9CAUL|nr:hypothetical protein C1707_18170 [Caulobacter flavus]PLR16294.1 hypothetical protein CFHF_11145 [Caulobacter flavus]
MGSCPPRIPVRQPRRSRGPGLSFRISRHACPQTTQDALSRGGRRHRRTRPALRPPRPRLGARFRRRPDRTGLPQGRRPLRPRLCRRRHVAARPERPLGLHGPPAGLGHRPDQRRPAAAFVAHTITAVDSNTPLSSAPTASMPAGVTRTSAR